MHKTTDKTASRATRRGFFATSAVAGAAGFSLLSGTELARAGGSPEADAQAAAAYPPKPRAPTGDTAVRPFRVHVPEAVLADLRRRVKATRWPDRETVSDLSQGVRLGPVNAIQGVALPRKGAGCKAPARSKANALQARATPQTAPLRGNPEGSSPKPAPRRCAPSVCGRTRVVTRLDGRALASFATP